MNYYHTTGASVEGPTATETLINDYYAGTLPQTTQVCAEGSQVWAPISSLLTTAAINPPSIPQAPQAQPVYVQMAPQGDATGGVIPYKNPMALTAYYLGVFSLIPVLGFVLAIPAVILGVLGLRARKRNPAIRGSAHAYAGIILGSLVIIAHLAFIVFISLH